MAGMEEDDEKRDVDAMLRELEMKLDRLRAMYDQYFLGIEKMPPLVLRKDVVRLIADLQKQQIRRTATRFRMQQQIQRFNTMRTRWARTEREIESGTYKPHLRRADRRAKDREDPMALSAADEAAIQSVRDTLGEEAAKKAEFTRKEAAARAAAGVSAEADAFLQQLIGGGAGAASEAPKKPVTAQPGASSGAPAVRGMSTEEMALRKARMEAMKARVGKADPSGDPGARLLYEKLVATKRKLNESTEKISYAGLEKSLARQRDAVRQKHNCRDVDFDVVVKDGKAFIKPIPKF